MAGISDILIAPLGSPFPLHLCFTRRLFPEWGLGVLEVPGFLHNS